MGRGNWEIKFKSGQEIPGNPWGWINQSRWPGEVPNILKMPWVATYALFTGWLQHAGTLKQDRWIILNLAIQSSSTQLIIDDRKTEKYAIYQKSLWIQYQTSVLNIGLILRGDQLGHMFLGFKNVCFWNFQNIGCFNWESIIFFKNVRG